MVHLKLVSVLGVMVILADETHYYRFANKDAVDVQVVELSISSTPLDGVLTVSPKLASKTKVI